MEKKTEVRSFEVSYICDRCNEGMMIFTGITLTSYPPQYQHKCDQCSNTQNFRVVYPTIRYEVTDEIMNIRAKVLGRI